MLVARCLVPDLTLGELNTTARMLNDKVASQPELERPFEDDVSNCDPDFRQSLHCATEAMEQNLAFRIRSSFSY